LTVLKILH